MSGKKKGTRGASRKSKYKDDHVSEDEEFVQTFDVGEKLRSKDFPKFFIKEIKGSELTIEYLQRKGFLLPIFISEKTGLQLNVPDSSFSVADVRSLIGSKRKIEVMNCATQQNSEMTLKEWEEFFLSQDRPDLKLNVLSLEFSQTKLDAYVSSPRVVRQIDWVENVWPRHLKEDQEDGTNAMDKMKYPKVQKYCLMSVAGCYTDFHIDFGGSSVWYHIVKGQKVFWLIPPTDKNLKAYEDWTLSGRQTDTFFGDVVEKCGRVVLDQGNTLLIPSGWIHAVYTPSDSIVFGGNFLHSFSIEKQLRVAEIEELTKVPHKFRFPFFTELQWYALDKYVYALLARSHLQVDDAVLLRLFGEKYERDQFRRTLEHQHLTPQELYGLKAIVMFIHALPVTRKNVPSLIRDPVSLIKDIRTIVETHKQDDPELAVTGKPLLFWSGQKQEKSWSVKAKNKMRREVKVEKETKKAERIPCQACESCLVKECGKCARCTSYPKKSCEKRKCEQPVLALQSICNFCGLDGWFAEPSMTLVDRPIETNNLLECYTCKQISHPACHTDYGVDGEVSEIIPNCWFCPKCMKFNPPSEQQLAAKTRRQDEKEQFVVRGRSDQSKSELRSQLADQIMTASTKTLKPPSYVFRPPPKLRKVEDVYERLEKWGPASLLMEEIIMLPVFQLLSTAEVVQCGLVCTAWHTISLDPSLWHTVDLTRKKISNNLLSMTVQKQPVGLILDWCNIGKQHLNWLLPRIPQTKELSMIGLEYNTAVSSLNTCNAPMLQVLNLSNVTSLTDSALHKLLTNPRDSRPGLLDKKSRLKNLKRLILNGTEISDVSMRYITQYLPQLATLSVSGCWKITDAGLAQLGAQETTTTDTLTSLDLSSCREISNSGMTHLRRCVNLTRIDVTNTQVKPDALSKFVQHSKQKLKVYDGCVVDKRPVSKKGRKS